MKFYIYSTKENVDKDLERLEKLVKKLFKNCEVETSKVRLPKYKQDKLESEGTFVLKVEDILLSNNKETAYVIMGICNIGVSEKVLNTL